MQYGKESDHRSILLTGASGFLGSIIRQTLVAENVITLGRSRSDIICDLAAEIPLITPVDIVIHSAGKAHFVPKTDEEKQEFFDTNVTGTRNLLMSLEQNVPQAFIFISSVSVYGLETGINIKEDHPLNATDPYGKSKILSEQMITEWCKDKGVTCTIFRLPLIAGENAPGNLGSMIRGIEKGYYFNIGGGKARKSIVLATDIAQIILEAAKTGGIFNLTDGYHPTFRELSESIAGQLRKPIPLNMPFTLANLLAKAGDLLGSRSPINTVKLRKITTDLTFDDTHARKVLKWDSNPVLNFKIK